MRKKTISKILFWIAVAVLVTVILFPYVIMFMVSIKDSVEAIRFPPTILPKEPTGIHWRDIFNNSVFPFLTYFGNSMYVAGVTGLITTVLGIFSGYALARGEFRGKYVISELFFFIYMFSGLLLIVPLYKLCVRLGLNNTKEAVILCMVIQTMPTAIYMIRSYFTTIPEELEDAGRVDGLSRLGVIFRIVVPLSIPGIISVFVYAFMIAWNDVLFVQIFIDSSELKTLTIGLNTLFDSADYIWGRMMAASIATALPIVAMYSFSQYLIKGGLTDGGVKG